MTVAISPEPALRMASLMLEAGIRPYRIEGRPYYRLEELGEPFRTLLREALGPKCVEQQGEMYVLAEPPVEFGPTQETSNG